MKRISVVLATLIVFGLLLSACGGAGGGDPVSVVKDMMRAVQDERFDAIADFVCAAEKEAITSQFDFRQAYGGSAENAQKMLDAIAFDLSGLTYEKTSESGDKAVVSVKGKLVAKVDREKIKSVIADLLTAEGMPTDDATVNQSIDLVAGQFESGQDISTDFDLVKEGGAWKICGATNQ